MSSDTKQQQQQEQQDVAPNTFTKPLSDKAILKIYVQNKNHTITIEHPNRKFTHILIHSPTN